MTVEFYKKRMAEMGIDRENLEERIKPFYTAHPREWRESAYLPGGEAKSIVPERPPCEDLSAMNSPSWHKLQAAGRKNGRRKKR